MEAALCTIMHWVDDPKVMARTQALTENFAAPYNVVFWGVDEGGTVAAAAERHGALSISSEIGGYGRVSVEGLRYAERGLDNVLKGLGMIDGKPDTSHPGGGRTRQMQVRDQRSYLFAPSDGLFEPTFLPGSEDRELKTEDRGRRIACWVCIRGQKGRGDSRLTAHVEVSPMLTPYCLAKPQGTLRE